jgi:PHP family Zn ribbon phosphoesterase
MNTFYGKQVNQMNFNELTLLSVDIQLMSFEKVNNIPNMVLEQSLVIREGLMYKCIGGGGDYSRERFVNDFNETQPMELEGGYDDYIEVTNFISLN